MSKQAKGLADTDVNAFQAMKWRFTYLPVLAAPISVFAHILSEALASGRGLMAVAQEPSHLYLFVLSLLAIPFWTRAAGARRLAPAIFAFTALSLIFDGLDTTVLIPALLFAALVSWTGGSAVQAATLVSSPSHTRSLPHDRLRILNLPTDTILRGPYAYVVSHGNRAPPRCCTH
jgi:hypothetical protein